MNEYMNTRIHEYQGSRGSEEKTKAEGRREKEVRLPWPPSPSSIPPITGKPGQEHSWGKCVVTLQGPQGPRSICSYGSQACGGQHESMPHWVCLSRGSGTLLRAEVPQCTPTIATQGIQSFPGTSRGPHAGSWLRTWLTGRTEGRRWALGRKNSLCKGVRSGQRAPKRPAW